MTLTMPIAAGLVERHPGEGRRAGAVTRSRSRARCGARAIRQRMRGEDAAARRCRARPRSARPAVKAIGPPASGSAKPVGDRRHGRSAIEEAERPEIKLTIAMRET